jgi:hypothetical protein
MDTQLSQLTVSGLAGTVVGLTIVCTLLVLFLKTFWDTALSMILFRNKPDARLEEIAVDAALEALEEHARNMPPAATESTINRLAF